MAATTLLDRSVLRLSGEDVPGFLQGLVTHDMTTLTTETPLWAGLLTPQGKALFDFILWRDGDDVLIDCEADAAQELSRRLTLYRLRRKIRIEPDPALAVHWSLDPAEGVPDPRLAELGYRWLATAAAAAEGWRAHRLALGVAEGRAELGSDKTLWLECNAAELNGVSFTKGCYVGQENTARMNYRSKVNRRLVVVPAEAPGERTRTYYPELGFAVEHRRIDDLGGAIIPNWLAAALG
ncbi:CAF17-like 4Fe-4S cluster assembly/insertion protein YgfZ [Allosphingosinicella deserti]|uniref:Folate-binding protein YgfZ n=1 Tax=Allosphingosinicella deserti TaxID=2116704 RepID=A0A2P7QGF6_9SPHN|nr:folate-binding protein YgfZ [Sphingomonas deserti]PSJ37049.1 folate-binding protein YgfZ [Sphingomonas deserti]